MRNLPPKSAILSHLPPFNTFLVDQLIQLALKVASPMQGSFYRKEENQCYYCFYGISLSVSIYEVPYSEQQTTMKTRVGN